MNVIFILMCQAIVLKKPYNEMWHVVTGGDLTVNVKKFLIAFFFFFVPATKRCVAQASTCQPSPTVIEDEW